jgi:uncharacterized membrane protein
MILVSSIDDMVGVNFDFDIVILGKVPAETMKSLIYAQLHNHVILSLISMRKSILVKLLLVVGFVLVIAGIIFVAQSNSMIGPQSSFMYSNPIWTVNGFAVSISGLVIVICGLLIRFIDNKIKNNQNH